MVQGGEREGGNFVKREGEKVKGKKENVQCNEGNGRGKIKMQGRDERRECKPLVNKRSKK